MTLVADILLAAGAIAAAFYCFILGRRLRRFNDLEKGVGGAVAVLSAQVDDLDKSLASARNSAQISSEALLGLVERAEDVRRQLELQMAALHDIVPTPAANSAPPPPAQPAAEAASEEVPPQPVQEAQSAEPMFTRHRSAS